ncbi:hypothetical protein PQX77_011461 [Marasmius sp. AFHP31]|nr:hypothetical protein PQX77_011461 [Marasmius sp. AFHP31]
MSTTTSKTIVLITGATGYIGGSVLTRLLALPDASSKFDFRAIVRNSDKAQKLKELFGVKSIQGSHLDRELMVRETSQADVVVTMADCDDMEALGAILDGLKKRYEATGKAPVLFHTSGAAVLSDNAGGESSQVIWDDNDVAQLATIAPDAAHRPPELKVLDADHEGYVKTYIITPTATYGAPKTPLVDAGIQNTRSAFYNFMMTAVIPRGQGLIVGKGENIWPAAHIDELADVYAKLFAAVVEEKDGVPHGREGYFFVEAVEFTFYEVAEEVNKALKDFGKLKGTSTDPTPITKEECVKYFGPMADVIYGFAGSNTRCISTRAKNQLGWKPNKTKKDFMANALPTKMSSATTKTVVLITGATGYIGGSVLTQLLALPDASSKFDFRAIIRNSEKAQKFRDLFGVNAILGSHLDRELMVREASQADVVLAMADCNDTEAAGAILDGLRKRYEATGKAPILVHTSGTGALGDNACGESSDVIWDDANVAQMATIAPNAFHRPPELKVLDADQEGYVKAYIIAPSAIYGIPKSPLVDAGIQNIRTEFFTYVMTGAIPRGQGFIIGKGNNILPTAHIDELVDVYIKLFIAAIDDKDGIPHGKEGYFTVGADEFTFYEVAEATSKALNEFGRLKGTSTDPTPITKEECAKYYGPMADTMYIFLGSNTRCISTRAKNQLGWKPNKTKNDLLASVREDVEYRLSLQDV